MSWNLFEAWDYNVVSALCDYKLWKNTINSVDVVCVNVTRIECSTYFQVVLQTCTTCYTRVECSTYFQVVLQTCTTC